MFRGRLRKHQDGEVDRYSFRAGFRDQIATSLCPRQAATSIVVPTKTLRRGCRATRNEVPPANSVSMARASLHFGMEAERLQPELKPARFPGPTIPSFPRPWMTKQTPARSEMRRAKSSIGRFEKEENPGGSRQAVHTKPGSRSRTERACRRRKQACVKPIFPLFGTKSSHNRRAGLIADDERTFARTFGIWCGVAITRSWTWSSRTRSHPLITASSRCGSNGLQDGPVERLTACRNILSFDPAGRIIFLRDRVARRTSIRPSRVRSLPEKAGKIAGLQEVLRTLEAAPATPASVEDGEGTIDPKSFAILRCSDGIFSP